MTDRPNPYSGLDRAMVRNTRPTPPTTAEPTPRAADPTGEEDERPETDAAPAPAPTRAKPRTAKAKAPKAVVATSPPFDLIEPPIDPTPDAPDVARARYSDALIERLRKAVKATGREVSFVRLTPGEKEELGDLLYEFRKRGMKTTENEVNRIAINYLLLDYRRHGDESVLYRVVAALLA